SMSPSYSIAHHPVLPSFPTRRSSDLDPVVDEPRVALVDVLLAPHHPQQRDQAHLALGVLPAAGERVEDGRYAREPLRADRGHQRSEERRVGRGGRLGWWEGELVQ